jgi:hypothetical protein
MDGDGYHVENQLNFIICTIVQGSRLLGINPHFIQEVEYDNWAASSFKNVCYPYFLSSQLIAKFKYIMLMML